MAYLNITGAETGDLSEAFATTGTVAVYTTNKRTGAYAYHLTGGTSTLSFGKFDAQGVHVALGMTSSPVYGTCYVKFLALAGSCFQFGVKALNPIAYMNVTNTGDVTLVGTTTSSSIGTVTTGVWYRFDILCTKSGTCTASIDGGTSQTVTGNAENADYIFVSGQNGGSDNVVDDIAISDSGYPGAGEVRILKPNGTGNYTSWTDGAGTAPTNVAEVPHDSDTGYITSSTATQAETEALDSAATGGVTGTIGAVKSVVIVRDEAGVSSLNIRTRSATTNQDTTAIDPGATYVLLGKLNDTDPATSAAWTTGGLDSLEVGVLNNNAVAVRCTAIYAMVWCTGASAALAAGRRSLLGVGV